MRRLNQKGLAKVIPLLKGQYTIDGNIIVGKINLQDHRALLDVNIIVERIGDDRYYLLHEQEIAIEPGTEDPVLDKQQNITQPKQPIDTIDGEERKLNPTDIRALLTQIVPHLQHYFPTKDEVNAALNDLKANMIDPEEWIEMFKGMGKKIKKQSRPDDEVG